MWEGMLIYIFLIKTIKRIRTIKSKEKKEEVSYCHISTNFHNLQLMIDKLI